MQPIPSVLSNVNCPELSGASNATLAPSSCVLLSVWFLITILGSATAGFLGPGRITLGAYWGGVWMEIISQPEDRY